MQRHFPYQHPTFGTAKNPKPEHYWKNTVYYWWWQYLKRNNDYIATCEQGGKGKCAKLYEDFGDVRGDSFKDWWFDGGRNVHCFAEPPTPTIRIINESSNLDHDSDGVLLLAVPLNLPMIHLTNKFREIISKHHAGKRGERMSNKSLARYPISGKVDLAFLEDALKIWDERNYHPTKPIWLLVQELKIVSSKNWIVSGDSKSIATAKKNVLAATGSRLLKKADALIRNVGEGIFPKAT